ncbi:hypothetical protein ACF09H_17440 [Streptomyces sp. NPDC014983]|uniref:hypothetical protein n=1 Tax=Streptomyces sp. NPDC014983 TaxID=3364933 RepID=UPI0036F82305
MPEAEVSAEEVKAAQRAAMTRVVGRGMRDRYGQVPAAVKPLVLNDASGIQVAAIETCPTHVPYVQATARRRGFACETAAGPGGCLAYRIRSGGGRQLVGGYGDGDLTCIQLGSTRCESSGPVRWTTAEKCLRAEVRHGHLS